MSQTTLPLALALSMAALPAYGSFSRAPGFDNPERLALVRSDTSAEITGVVARVTIEQTYVNRSGEPIDARYVFPGSTRAAIDGLTMKIGDREIVAKIQKKHEARRTFRAAKAAGKTATLLEQHRPNVFETSVANILPGDQIKVTLTYTELLVPEERVYELVLPQVVMQRFGAVPWGTNTGERTPGARVRVVARAGMPIRAFEVASHVVAPWIDEDEAHVTIDAPDGFDRDVIVRYRLAGDHVQTGVLLNEGKDGGEFLLMVQPPARVAPNAIPPREYVFIVDVSGSMHGFPLDVTRGLLRSLVQDLRPVDRFNVLCFASSSAWLASQPVQPSRVNLARAIGLMDKHEGGGTSLSQAVHRALSAPRRDGVSTTFVLITDGFIAADREAYELVRKNLGEANVFVFGIGGSVNRHLVESVAKAGMGHPFVATNHAEAKRVAGVFQRYVSSPVLTGVRLQIDGLDAYDLEPAHIPDVLADRPVVVMGKYRGQPRGSLTIRGRGGANRVFEQKMPLEVTHERHPAIPKLWARARIEQLTIFYDITRDFVAGEEIERLGLEYSLMTSRTSFVAVDDTPRAPAQISNRTPAPSKTNTEVTATPELDPGAAGASLLLLFACAALFLDRRRT